VVLTKFILSRTVHPHPLQGITILKDQDTAKMPHKKLLYTMENILHDIWDSLQWLPKLLPSRMWLCIVWLRYHGHCHGVTCQENSNLAFHVFLLPSMFLNFRQNKCHSPLMHRSNAYTSYYFKFLPYSLNKSQIICHFQKIHQSRDCCYEIWGIHNARFK
jgi:hypothetical protein